MPASREWLHQSIDRRVATAMSLALHASLVLGIATCPPSTFPSLRLAPEDFRATRRDAPPRLLYLMPRATRASLPAPRSASRKRMNVPAKPSSSMSTFDEAVLGISPDTIIPAGTVSAVAPPARTVTRADSAASNSAGYFRSVHPALRGLVPEWNGGALWGGGVSAAPVSVLPALRPRPPECPNGMVGFVCGALIMKWRDDSIYHVNVLCHRDPKRVGQRLPADCNRYRPDSILN